METSKPIIITVRLIRSMEYRVFKNLIMHTTTDLTVSEFMKSIQQCMFASTDDHR